MENNKQPRTIFDAINENIVSMSEDMNLMHGKVDDLLAKVDVLYNALVPAQVGEDSEPNATGDASSEY
jgi:hypothetical protein